MRRLPSPAIDGTGAVHAKAAGIPISEEGAKEQTVQLESLGVGLTEEYLQALFRAAARIGSPRCSLDCEQRNYQADSYRRRCRRYGGIAGGRWELGAGEVQLRPPHSVKPFASTARCIGALEAYSIPARKEEFTERIARARAWLSGRTRHYRRRCDAAIGADHVWRARIGISEGGKGFVSLSQRPDGGWGGNPYMKTDAYATGGALVALAESKLIKVADPPIGEE